MRSRAALASSITGAIALIGGWTLAAALQPAGFDPGEETISALAAEGMPYRWVMTAGIAITGVCHVLTAWLLPGLRRPGRVLYTVAGIATVGVALLPEPSRTGSSAAHGAVATTAFVLLALWPALAGRREVGGLLGRRWTLLAALVMALLVASLGSALQGPLEGVGLGFGLHERIVAGVEVVYPVLLALATLRPPDARRTPAD
ncbi:DUF998 domain-containing protein [Alteromonas gracilis]